MEAIVFSDFRLVSKFVDKCRVDIEAKGRGRLPGLDEDPSKIMQRRGISINQRGIQADSVPHKQGATIACLQEHVTTLKPECRKEILRIR